MQYFCVLGQAEPVKSQIVFRFQLLRGASRTIPGVKLHEPAFSDTRSQPVLRPMFPLTCDMLLEAVAHGEIWFNLTTVFLFACSSVHHASLWSMSSLREALEIYSHWGCNYFSIRFGEEKNHYAKQPKIAFPKPKVGGTNFPATIFRLWVEQACLVCKLAIPAGGLGPFSLRYDAKK